MNNFENEPTPKDHAQLALKEIAILGFKLEKQLNVFYRIPQGEFVLGRHRLKGARCRSYIAKGFEYLNRISSKLS